MPEDKSKPTHNKLPYLSADLLGVRYPFLTKGQQEVSVITQLDYLTSGNNSFKRLIIEIWEERRKKSALPNAFLYGATAVIEAFRDRKTLLTHDISELPSSKKEQAAGIFKDTFNAETTTLDDLPKYQNKLIQCLKVIRETNHDINLGTPLGNRNDKEGFDRGAVAAYKMFEFLWPDLYPQK